MIDSLINVVVRFSANMLYQFDQQKKQSKLTLQTCLILIGISYLLHWILSASKAFDSLSCQNLTTNNSLPHPLGKAPEKHQAKEILELSGEKFYIDRTICFFSEKQKRRIEAWIDDVLHVNPEFAHYIKSTSHQSITQTTNDHVQPK